MRANEESVFAEALEIDDPHERTAFLDRACAGDPGLRHSVESLLSAYGAGQFLEAPAAAAVLTGADPAVAERPGSVLGPYKLLEQIGEGGFGVVFMAEQTQPVRRKVALKVLKPGMDSRQVIARFEAERQALALMDHPHIAHVFDGGTTAAGRPYFVMELVRGVPLTDFCDRNQLAVRQRLELFITVCQAVQHAHQKGIIHRDLKPSNVLVTLHDEKPVAKVIDFGIAKATGQQLTDKTLFTHFAQMVGTPLYMSPEQAQLSGLDVDTRTDIYSLGVLLYELLTGTTPFTKEHLQQAGYDEMRRIIREEEPPRPSTRLSTLGPAAAMVSTRRQSDPKRLRQLFRGELDWIVMKALEKDRNRRYDTATGLARDVERYLQDEPVQACPPSAGYRFRKFARRHKAILAGAGLVGCILFLLLIVGVGAFVNTALRDERDLAETNRQRAVTAEQRARDAERESKIRAHLGRAMAFRHSRQVGQRTRTLAEVAEALRLNPPQELRQELRTEAIAALCLPDIEVAREWDGRPPGTEEIEFGPDLEYYARADTAGQVSVRRVSDDVEIARLPSSGKVAWMGLTMSLDGRFLAQRCLPNQRLRLWRLDGPKPEVVLEDVTGSHHSTVAFRADSRQLAIPQPGASVRVYDTATGRLVNRWAVPEAAERLVFRPDGAQLAVGSRSTVRLLDADKGKVLAEFSHPSRIACLAWHPQGDLLGVSCTDRKIYLWDALTGKEALPPLEGHTAAGIALCFNGAGDRLVSAAWDGILRLWDPRTGRQLLESPGGGAQLCFSRDGRLVGSFQGGSKLGLLRILPGQESGMIRSPQAANLYYGEVRLHPDGRLVAVYSARGLALVDLAAGKELAVIPSRGHAGLAPLGFEPSGALRTYGEGGLRRWPVGRDAAEPGLLRLGPPERLTEAQTLDGWGQSADGRVVALPNYSAGAVVLHLEQPPRRLTLAPQRDVRRCAVSPDGRWVATGSHGEVGKEGAKVWEAATGKLVKTLPVGGLCTATFSPDGRWLATGSGIDKLCHLWAVGSWEAGPKLANGFRFAFSPDGRALAAGGELQGSVLLLETATGKELARLATPDRTFLVPACFTADGGQLLAVGQDSGALYFWDLQVIRRQLAELGLDWDAPPLPLAEEVKPPLPLRVSLDLGRHAPYNPRAAVALYSLAIALQPLNPEAYRRRGTAYSELRQWPLAVADFTRALLVGPAGNEPVLRSQRGHAYGAQGQFDSAAADFARAVESRPAEPFLWYCHAMAKLGADDRDGYRRVCAAMRQQLRMTNDPGTVARVVFTCVVVPETPADTAETLRLAGLAVGSPCALASACYRFGQYEATIHHYERSGKGFALRGVDLLFLAMAQHRLGQEADARESFARAAQWFDGATLPVARGDSWSWYDQVEVRCLRREAERLLRGN
jgi:serine/threonine protein kinase/WD40 repeat protein/tetratricopeptide (TPR) repeat protein